MNAHTDTLQARTIPNAPRSLSHTRRSLSHTHTRRSLSLVEQGSMRAKYHALHTSRPTEFAPISLDDAHTLVARSRSGFDPSEMRFQIEWYASLLLPYPIPFSIYISGLPSVFHHFLVPINRVNTSRSYFAHQLRISSLGNLFL